MSHQLFDRRLVLRWGMGVATGTLLGGRASAQSVNILGIPINLGAITIPVKPLNMVRMIAEIIDLEKKANSQSLPFSPLDAVMPPPLVPADDSFYLAAMPRLVSLIDRSEATDPATADKAGELLAQVNAEQHMVPDALKPETLRVSRAFDFASLRHEYGAYYDQAEIRPEHAAMLDWYKRMILQSRPRYEAVSEETNVPWYFIGAVHGLEASFNFRAHLHNGDFPLTSRTRQVPAGRPLIWAPPTGWEASAKDALRLMGFAGQQDWSLERTLYRLEAYNGFGYRKRAVPTPYLWSFSNHYERGKFIADGRWSPTARSQQCGAAVLLKNMAKGGDIKLG